MFICLVCNVYKLRGVGVLCRYISFSLFVFRERTVIVSVNCNSSEGTLHSKWCIFNWCFNRLYRLRFHIKYLLNKWIVYWMIEKSKTIKKYFFLCAKSSSVPLFLRFGIRGFLVLGMDSDGVWSVAGRSFSGPNGFCGRNFRACVDKRSRRGFGGSRSLTGAGYSKLTGPSGDRTISVIESPPLGCISPKAGRPAMTPRYCASIQLTCWSLQGCRGLLDLSMPPPGVALSPRCPRIALAHKENPLNDPDLLLKRTPEHKSLTSRST